MDKIAVLDFGGQYAHLIANRVRRLGVYSDIFDGEVSASELKDGGYKGVILSGGPQSVHEKDSLQADSGIFELGVPVLGICYGHQVISHMLGGRVDRGEVREYGLATVSILNKGEVFEGLENEEQAWMSHFDQVVEVPSGFEVSASTSDCPIAGMWDAERRIFSVQFHPEVTHTPNGMKVLGNFVGICGAKKEWSIEKFIEQEVATIKDKVGDKKVFMLVSGGVDSTVAFTLLEKALGNDRVFGLFVDIGFMREGEVEQVTEALKGLGITNLRVEDAAAEYFEALKEVYEPEQKRGIIGKLFLDVQKRVFEEMSLDPAEWILGQGTIYPDTIETGGTKHADTIKTHHNRVPEIQALIDAGQVIEPIAQLYKDEVRGVGEKLGLPHDMVWRHPFPGPGLAVRCLCSEEEVGDVEDLSELNSKISSEGYDAIVLPVKSVGVQGDVRSYQHPVVLSGGEKNFEKLEAASIALTNSFAEVNRGLYLLSGDVEDLELKKVYLTRERIAVLQKADKIVMDFLYEKGLEKAIWQFPTVLVPLGSAGGSGESIVLRPVESEEAMTANFYKMDFELLEELVGRLEKVEGVDAVFYDITNKPPATIEWE
ncbi:glutamine-hydrolyzing GMP synthase [Candidatus Peregrinibacteria bacterium]|nr:glutamine-hydrolyzing GMP synthase [Candidatus Peregrinibacteria bacterium]